MNGPLLALAGAAALIAAVPAWLLAPSAPAAPPPSVAAPPPIVPSPAAAIDAALASDPFAAAGGVTEAAVEDAPALAGIVGRLPDHIVALVRRGGGAGTRILAPGESIDGWRLDALSTDAALFVRGERRVRVGVAAGE